MKCIIATPIDNYGGYPDRGRDFTLALIEQYPEWDIKILKTQWGDCEDGYFKHHPNNVLEDKIIEQIGDKPDVFIHHTLPTEFNPIGKKLNIGLTAGVETTLCPPKCLEGINRMDYVIVSSNFSKKVINGSVFSYEREGVKHEIKCETPVISLFEGMAIPNTKETKETRIVTDLDKVQEDFLFFNMSTWLKGKEGEDRKNILLSVEAFLNSFMFYTNPPALLLFLKKGRSSTFELEKTILPEIRRKIKKHQGVSPRIYVYYGKMTEQELNTLYSHPKIKCYYTLTKGEGFGRPLLQAGMNNIPIVAPEFSGYLDFLDSKNSPLIPGELTHVHPSASDGEVLIEQAKWISVERDDITNVLFQVYEEYDKFQKLSQELGKKLREEYSYDNMKKDLKTIVNKIIKKESI